ncbi:MAG TPA: molybdopterin-dependent oxidoreductase, partial [Burkholderiaceae bacterium]|nr:molybdopterin-dependent oxidoreductase [Burkholderiaceae bacterium]
ASPAEVYERRLELLELADCLLPIAPFTETAGTFVNMEGRAQSFNGVVRPAGECRPGWKVLRVLGNLLELPGFDQDSAEAVRAQALPEDIAARLDNRVAGAVADGDRATADADRANDGRQAAAGQAAGIVELERLADVPIYAVDPLVRRAPSLQRTRDAAQPTARVNAGTLERLGLQAGDKVRVAMSAGGGEALVELAVDPAVADGVLRLAAGHPSTSGLGAMSGTVRIARA